MQAMLDIYTDYLIWQTKYATSTGLSAMLGGEISQDSITRFLNKKTYGSKDLWKFVKAQALNHHRDLLLLGIGSAGHQHRLLITLDLFRNPLLLGNLKEARRAGPECTLMYTSIRAPNRRTNYHQH